jgi:hypothetical protein
VLAVHLVGRADELGSIDEVLAELGRGRPGAIELAGEPGIGKTRLLRELAAPRGGVRAAGTLRLRVRAGAELAVLGLRGRAG